MHLIRAVHNFAVTSFSVRVCFFAQKKKTTTTTTTTTTITITTIVPIASLRFLPRRMTHLSERIIPHLGGLGRDPSLCCSHSPQPALLGQETSLHGAPAPEDTPKRTAHSGKYDTPPAKNYYTVECSDFNIEFCLLKSCPPGRSTSGECSPI